MKNTKLGYLGILLILISLFTINAYSQDVLDDIKVKITGSSKSKKLKELFPKTGKKVLKIPHNRAVEFVLEKNATLKSTEPSVVELIQPNLMIGYVRGVEVKITVKRGTDVSDFFVEVEDDDINKLILSRATYLPFKTVKDNFGKKFAQTYFVIQVDVRNETLDKQYVVQSLDVIFDANQCNYASELYDRFDANECLRVFDKYFKGANPQTANRDKEVINTGEADLNRSYRNLSGRGLKFSASIGTILSGFGGVFGPDGVKGVNVLGTTFAAAFDALFPNTADKKLENLKNAIFKENVIIPSKESMTLSMFVPTERVFYDASWEEYIKPTRKSSEDTYILKTTLDMILLSRASGVLLANDAPKAVSKSDDDLKNQKDKFDIKRIDGALVDTALLNKIFSNLKSEIDKGGQFESDTRGELEKIFTALKAEAQKNNSDLKLTPANLNYDSSDSATTSYNKLVEIRKDAFDNGAKIDSNTATNSLRKFLRVIEKAIK